MLTDQPARRGAVVALLSLEDWDQVWRRNQHLATRLVGRGAVRELHFLEPPTLGRQSRPVRDPRPGVCAIPLGLRLPKRFGGLAELGGRLRRGVLRRADVLWINDPALGVHCLRRGQPAVYDVTDDWRSYDFPPRIIRRIERAEDILARSARTIVCSAELRDRWKERYGVEAAVVHNGVDMSTWRAAEPRPYAGRAPHVGYVGTLEAARLDVDLVLRVADDERVGTVHLVGPDALDARGRALLTGHSKVVLHGAVPASEVASWTKGLDVLLSPHLITPFTLSLDAIKSYEYLASGRPVVATPTSGFHLLAARPGVHVATGSSFVDAIDRAVSAPRPSAALDELDWGARAREFAAQLLADHPVAR